MTSLLEPQTLGVLKLRSARAVDPEIDAMLSELAREVDEALQRLAGSLGVPRCRTMFYRRGALYLLEVTGPQFLYVVPAIREALS